MNTKIKTESKAVYTVISKGVRMYTNKKNKNIYEVRKTIKGVNTREQFTNKAKAIKFYKTL